MEAEDKENKLEGEKNDVPGFADQLASSLVKETIQEAGAGGEGDWSIPCSSVCHQQHKTVSDQCDHGGEVTKRRSGSGQLCWTPESGASMETGHSQAGTGQCHESPVRRGVSVPNVSVSDHVGDSGAADQDTVSCSSDNIKSPRKGFLSSLGLRTKVKATNHSQNNVRPKMKNFKKTISSIFSHKSRSDSEPGANKISNLFKLPSSVRHKLAPVDPCNRALPPVPPPRDDVDSEHEDQESLTPHHSPSLPINEADQSDNMDFAASIEKVKDRGWYWGPLSGEAAERILSGEPDGSFVVRDSSDHHYIFSLTFKLNGFVRHVRIEHDQGNFSFGSFTRFKSTTIVEFIENAVEHSRSGRYLFFLHRRPVLGPMRVQLLHPVSRFKRVQSLQHLCRYVIVKVVRKDHLDQLPVPSRIKKYLNTPFYYSEQIAESEESSEADNNLELLQENDRSDNPIVEEHSTE